MIDYQDLEDRIASLERITRNIGIGQELVVGSLHALDRVTAAEVLEKRPRFDVRAYGAVLDGSTSDVVAVQEAIDTADDSDTGGVVYIPASTSGCIIGTPGLTLKPKASLIGDAYGSKLIATEDYSLIKNDPTLAKAWKNQFIANLNLSYESYDPSWENARLIKMTGTGAQKHPFRNLIYNIYLQEAYAGFRDTSVGWGWALINVHTHNCRYGIWKEGGTTMTFIDCVTDGKGDNTYDNRGWYIADCGAPVLIGCGLDGWHDSGDYTDPDDTYEAAALFADCKGLNIKGFDLEVSHSIEDAQGAVVRFHNCKALSIDGIVSYNNQIHLGDGAAYSALLRFSGTTRGRAGGLGVGGDYGDAAYGGNAAAATVQITDTAVMHFSGCDVTRPADGEGTATRRAFASSSTGKRSVLDAVVDDGFIYDLNDNLVRGIDEYIHIRDQKADGTQGGNFASGAWRTRVLTNELQDTGGDAALASNQITLEAGTYRVFISCPGFKVEEHQARLYSITDTSTILVGTSERVDAGQNITTRSIIVGRFTITAQKVVEVQHRCTTTHADGFGRACTYGVVEVYTEAQFWKEL